LIIFKIIAMTNADKSLSSTSSFRITGYLDFGLKNTTFRKLDLFLSSGEGVGDTYFVGFVVERLRLALSSGSMTVGVPHSSSEEGNGFTFRNVLLCSLEYGMMDKVQKLDNPKSYKPLSEPL
jgi:hypothetical protein